VLWQAATSRRVRFRSRSICSLCSSIAGCAEARWRNRCLNAGSACPADRTSLTSNLIGSALSYSAHKKQGASDPPTFLTLGLRRVQFVQVQQPCWTMR
jgi:hypothetical protein